MSKKKKGGKKGGNLIPFFQLVLQELQMKTN